MQDQEDPIETDEGDDGAWIRENEAWVRRAVDVSVIVVVAFVVGAGLQLFMMMR